MEITRKSAIIRMYAGDAYLDVTEHARMEH